jgi:hypothetical protein
MKIFKKSVFPTILLFSFLLTTGCQKKNKEMAPFFDGLYFKYEVSATSGNSEDVFKVKKMNGGYEVILDEFYGSHNVGEIVKNIVDLYGVIKEKPIRARKASKRTKKIKWLKGRRICIWIPLEEIKIGSKFETSLGNYRVIEQKNWEDWKVWMLKDGSGNESYYDRGTGFLVGSKSISLQMVGSMKRILIDTNADIPY